MNGTVNARVRRVVIGHSERALIHAVDGDNLEFKIEVPSEAVRGLVPGQELMLTLSWKLEPRPWSVPASASRPSVSGGIARGASSVEPPHAPATRARATRAPTSAVRRLRLGTGPPDRVRVPER